MVGRGLAPHITPATTALSEKIEQRQFEWASGIESMATGPQPLAQAAKVVTMLV
jgi:hypothetical protein